MSEEIKHLCPRRLDDGISPVFKVPVSDVWREYPTKLGHLVCSYCGSIHPDDFLAAVDGGEEVVPTDKNYKVYLGETRKFYLTHLNEAQKLKFVDLVNSKKMNIGYPGHFYVLPFFMTAKKD